MGLIGHSPLSNRRDRVKAANTDPALVREQPGLAGLGPGLPQATLSSRPQKL